MNQLIYDFLSLTKQDKQGATYTIGHAIVWNPISVRMELVVSHASLETDWFTKAFAPYYLKIEPWKELIAFPGMNVREAIDQCPGGIAYFNVGESGIQINPLIENGRLLTKPTNCRACLQKEYELLNDVFTFFLQHADGCAEIRDLRIVQNQIYFDDSQYLHAGTNGFSIPYILKNGKRVPLKNPPPGQTAKSGETLYTLGAPAALCAVGLMPDGNVVWVGLIGDVANPTNWDRIGTEDDLVRYLVDLGVRDALFAGASGDVQYYDAKSKTLCVAAERPKIPEKRWLLKPGQTERGLTCIVKLVATNQVAGDIEDPRES